MRISTSMIYDKGVASIQNQTRDLLKVQQQIATGRKILTPSDDPVAAARSLEVVQSQRINAQYQGNQNLAQEGLQLVEGQLASVVGILQTVRDSTIQGANGGLSAVDRQAVVATLKTQFDALVAAGNAKDGSGRYVFAGFKSDTQPFVGTLSVPVSYQGDNGQVGIQISASRQIPATISGEDVFMNIPKDGGGKQSLFDTVSSIINTLQTSSGPALSAAVPGAIRNLDAALDNVLRVQSNIGSHINEVQAQMQQSSNLDLYYQQTLSSLQDVDYASAISRMTQLQGFLEAAQKSFQKVMGLSLFNTL